MRRLGWAAALWLALAGGCGGGEQFLALPELGLDVLFVFGLDDEGQTLEVAGPLVLDESTTGDRSAVLSASELRVVGWSHDALGDSTVLYDRARASQIELGFASAPSCQPDELDAQSMSILTAAPASTETHTLTLDGLHNPVESSPDLVLRLPVDLDACVPESRGLLRPFADREFPISVGSELLGHPVSQPDLSFRDVHLLDDGRLLALSAKWLFLFETGRTFRAEPSHALLVPETTFQAFAVDDDTSRHGDQPLVTIAGTRDLEPVSGLVVDVRVTASGFEVLGTSSISSRMDELVVRQLDGRLVGVAVAGFVLTRVGLGAEVELLPAPWMDIDSFAQLGLTGDPEHPYVASAGNRGGVLLGDTDARVWTAVPARGLDINARVRALSKVEEGGREVWAGTSNGQVFRWEMDRDVWEQVKLPISPTLAACALPEGCGYFKIRPTVRGFEFFERRGVPRVLISLSECAGLVDLRLDGKCAGPIHIEGRPLDELTWVPELQSFLDFRATHFANGQLVVASQEGGVYVLDVEP